MKYLIAKDFNRRQAYKKVVFFRYKCCFFLRDGILLKSSYYKRTNIVNAYKKLFLYRYSSLSRVRNRCYMSGKSRAVFRKQKLSRIRMRESLRIPIVYGLRKACW